jgi:hypothetical protein
MATTTTNYGFDVPTSSDLVKNGATQIALLGQDLDTFLFRPFTRNGVLNSGFNVWQRGTSIACTSSAYTADRWQGYRAVAGGTVSRQVTGDSTNLPFIQYAARVQRDNGNTSTSAILFLQSMESINSIPYSGKTVTFSFYARKGANYSSATSAISVTVASGTGTDQNILNGFTGQTDVVNSTATLTTTWQRFTFTGSVGSTATQLGFYFGFTPVGTAGAADYFEVTGVMLEVGNQASPYAPATPTYATELAACQRYYYRESYSTTLMAAPVIASSTSLADFIWQYPVAMRIAPTLSSSSATNDFLVNTAATGSSYYSSISFLNVGVQRGQGRITVSGYTAGQAGFMVLNQSGAFLQASAEL